MPTPSLEPTSPASARPIPRLAARALSALGLAPAWLLLVALTLATGLAARSFEGPDPEATLRRNARPNPHADPELLLPHWEDSQVVKVLGRTSPQPDGYGRMTWAEWKRKTGRTRP